MANFLSIIIVSYNTKGVLTECLDLLIGDQTLKDVEIIVVDNASSDGTATEIKNNYKGVVLIKNDQNSLFARACNQGATIASGEQLLMLNSDTLPREGEITKLSNWLSNSSEAISCVGPRVLGLDGRLQSEGHPFPSINQTLVTFFAVIKWPIPNKIKEKMLPNGYHRFDYGNVRQVDWIGGCAMLIRKSAWDKIGGFDDKLYFYNEDVEWCYRAKKHEYEIYVMPQAEVKHIGGASSRKAINFEKRLKVLRGEKYFYMVTQGKAYHFVNQILILTLYPVSYVICKLLSLEFYKKTCARNIKKAVNTIRILANRKI